MRGYKTVVMRGGTSKGCMFLREDLPEDQSLWDDIFLQVMGSPDPKQIDGLGGTVSSNNKIVVVWKSKEPDVDVEYLVGQVVVGRNQVDYKSNCGNMTSAVGPFAVEEGLVSVTGPLTTVRLCNRNTNKYIHVVVPCENGSFAEHGTCRIAGVDGAAAEIKVNFLDPAGSKTGKLLPTGNLSDKLLIPEVGEVEVTILDVSNPMVLVNAESVGLTGLELPDEINANKRACRLLEQIRGTAACMMGFAKDTEDAVNNSPAIPKIGIFTKAAGYTDIAGHSVAQDDMDLCVRVISVFKCHKACPITSASAIAVAACLKGTVVFKKLGIPAREEKAIRVGHPGGVMTMYPDVEKKDGKVIVSGVAVQRTARRIMDGIVYTRD